MKIDQKTRQTEPPDWAKGPVARSSLYMAWAYPRYTLSPQQRQLFDVWNRKFPPEQFECTRTYRIEQLQGNENPFVKKPCQRDGRWPY